MPTGLLGKAWRLLGLLSICFSVVIVYSFWYAINSDQDNVSPLLTQLIPAGHCACRQATVFECQSCLEPQLAPINRTEHGEWQYKYGRDDRDLGLSAGQCSIAFPGLFEDIDRGARYWTETAEIDLDDLDDVRLVEGMTRAMIYKGDLYVIASRSKGEDHRRKIVATLSAMHRALSAAPDRNALEDLEFVFSVEDKASDVVGGNKPIWVFARKASEESLFLMPDFGYWSWDNMINGKNNEIGTYDDVVDNAKAIESKLDFEQKQAKLVWRGKLSFAPKLRRALVDVARGQDWGDVKEVNWNVRQNFLALEDHCKYQYIAHVEGRSYSASLKYRQACHSVVVAHKLQYIQHHHYLLSSHGTTQNYIEVERDFSDLPDKMAHVLAHPEEARRIADNSVKTFRERYLTPAAEACYWRKLWAGYAKVSESSRLNDDRGRKRGLRYETFLLLSSKEMLDFKAL